MNRKMMDGEYPLRELANDILVEMYEEAEPPLDFRNLLENPEQAEDGWYEEHHLSADEQRRILDEHIERFEQEERELTKEEHSTIVMECEVVLGPSNAPGDSDE